MKDRVLSLLITAFLSAGLTGGPLSTEDSWSAALTGGEATRTVMVYMVGADLESNAGLGTLDIQEMLDSGVDLDRVNVVVAAGGTVSWPSLDLSNGQMLPFRLSGGPDPIQPLDAVAYRNMGDASTLSYFLRLAQSACPSSRYDLILWDHGGGPVYGYGMDTVANDGLQMREITQALADAGFGSGRKLEMIGYDACLMGSAEVAALMAPYADYMVASEEVIPGSGWDYGFMGQSEMYGGDTEKLLRSICSAYERGLRGYANTDYTLSALRLDRAAGVWQAMDELFCYGAEFSTPGDLSTVAACVNASCAFSRFYASDEYDLFDLGDFARQAKLLLPKTSAALEKAVDACVLCSVSNMRGAKGLSFYFPMYVPENAYDYLYGVCSELTGSGIGKGYAEFLRTCFSGQTGGQHTLALPTIQGTVTPGAPVYYAQLTPELHASFAHGHYNIVTRYKNEPNAYRLVEQCGDVALDANGVLSVSRERKFHYIRVNRTDPWAEVGMYGRDTRNGVFRYKIIMSLFRMPADRPADWRTGNMELQLQATQQNPDGQLLWLVPATDNGMAPRELLEIEVGDILSSPWLVRMKTYDGAGNLLPFEFWPDYNPNGSQGVEGTVAATGIETAYLPGSADREYFIQLVVSDVAGNCYATELMPMQ